MCVFMGGNGLGLGLCVYRCTNALVDDRGHYICRNIYNEYMYMYMYVYNYNDYVHIYNIVAYIWIYKSKFIFY